MFVIIRTLRCTVQTLCALLLAVVAGCARGGGSPALHRLHACATDEGPNDALCGTLRVYEDRQANTGRRIPLNIVVLPAVGAEDPDPLFFLAGGPGQAAAKLAPQLRQGDTILLHGNLGTGKTVFARALIRALSGDEDLEVPSPTFTLVQTYDTPLGALWHFDLYRLENSDEIYELGWEEALSGGIMLVEWPERLGTLLPPSRLDIRLTPVKNKTCSRLIQVKKTG